MIATVATNQIAKKRAFIRGVLDAHAGQFFTATFIKGSGEVRVMNGRTGVKKHLKGGVSTVADKEHLYSCYDTVAEAYRCFTLDTVTQIKIGGKVLEFVTDSSAVAA
jgi:hypothetical protein